MKKFDYTRDLLALQKIAEPKAFKRATMDHPIYPEGATIIFISSTIGKTADATPQKPADERNVTSVEFADG